MTLKVSNESLVFIAFKFQGIHFRCLPATPLAILLAILFATYLLSLFHLLSHFTRFLARIVCSFLMNSYVTVTGIKGSTVNMC